MKIPLMCSLFGHKMVPQRGNMVVCERCDHPAEWSPEVVCRKFGHKFNDDGICERCKERLTPKNCRSHNFVVCGITRLERGSILHDESRPIAIRHYRCKCGTTKSDDPVREALEGSWWFKDGKLMSDSEIRAQGYTITRRDG